MHLNMIKAIYGKFSAIITLNGKGYKVFLSDQEWEWTRMPILATFNLATSNMVLEVLATATEQVNVTKVNKIINEEVKLSLLGDDNIFFPCNFIEIQLTYILAKMGTIKDRNGKDQTEAEKN